MNRCYQKKHLSAYLDNQLNSKKQLEINEHIKTCKICVEELTRLKAVSEKLKAWQVSDLKVGFDSSVSDKIVAWELGKDDLKMKRKTIAVLIPSGVLAGILVFLFVGMFWKTGYYGRLKGSGDVVDKQYVARQTNASGGRYENATAMSACLPRTMRTLSGASGNQSILNYLKFEEEPSKLAYRQGSESVTVNGSQRYMALAGGKSEVLRESSVSSPLESPERIDSYLPNYQGGPVIVIEPGLPATGQGEKIIRTGDVAIEVESGKQAYKKVSDLCQELGGYLASSNFYVDEQGREAGTITLRIPKDKFTVALERLSVLGKVQNIDTDSKDISQEYTNLTSQLDAAMVVYKKMLEALQKKQVTIPEAMRLESEITPILKRVQDLKNKIEYLNNQVSLTTITVRFFEAKVSIKALKESSRFIREGMISAGIKASKFLAIVVPVLIVLVIAIVIFISIVLLVKNWIIRFFKRG